MNKYKQDIQFGYDRVAEEYSKRIFDSQHAYIFAQK